MGQDSVTPLSLTQHCYTWAATFKKKRSRLPRSSRHLPPILSKFVLVAIFVVSAFLAPHSALISDSGIFSLVTIQVSLLTSQTLVSATDFSSNGSSSLISLIAHEKLCFLSQFHVISLVRLATLLYQLGGKIIRRYYWP